MLSIRKGILQAPIIIMQQSNVLDRPLLHSLFMMRHMLLIYLPRIHVKPLCIFFNLLHSKQSTKLYMFSLDKYQLFSGTDLITGERGKPSFPSVHYNVLFFHIQNCSHTWVSDHSVPMLPFDLLIHFRMLSRAIKHHRTCCYRKTINNSCVVITSGRHHPEVVLFQ